MYCTYHKPEEGSISIMRWDGDCHIWTVFESEAEKKAELARLKKIDDEAKAQHEAYIRYLESLEK